MRTRLIMTVCAAAAVAGVLVGAPGVSADDLRGDADGLTGTIVLGGGYTCRGERAVLAEDAYSSLTDGDDVVVAQVAVVDTLNTLGGNDLICIYPDPKAPYHGMMINTGAGHDTIVTYGGSNTIEMEDGDDIAYLNGVQEHVEGGWGSDHMWGLGADRVFLFGDGGADILQGSPANDSLQGGDNGDIIVGADGDDVIGGDGGDDSLQGGYGSDTITGGSGVDTCSDSSGTSFTSCEVVAYTPPFEETS